MQAKPITEHELVSICMAALCREAGFTDPGNLVQRDLQFLCERIESKTGVLISLSTIKRLINGQFSRLPQIATLDAIAIFLGYQHWQDCKNNIVREETSGESIGSVIAREETPPLYPPRRGRPVNARLLVWGIPLVLIAIGLLAIIKTEKHRLGHIDTAQFSAVKVTGNDIPNTVVFSYNIDTVTADSFFIQQSWDKNRRVRIYKHTHTLTDIYYEPGYHTAKLIANDQIIKKVAVSIPTDRWVFYGERSFGSQPKYILPAKGFINGALRLTREDLLHNNIDMQEEKQYVMVYFPSGIEGNSDNFRLTFNIKVNELNDDVCPYFMGEIFCQQYFMYFKSTLPGCISESVAQFGENFLSGKTNDLSTMGSNVKAWQHVEVTVENKRVSIRIDNREVFSNLYHQSCGLITGLGFLSNGLCEVDSIDLKTPDGKRIYPVAVTAKKQIMIPRIEGNYINIYKPGGDRFPGDKGAELTTGQFYRDWVPNDHCFVRSDSGAWHLYGITHPLTSVNAIHEGEVMSFHAVAPPGSFKQSIRPGAWQDNPKILTPAQRSGDLPDLYAPTPVKKDGLNYLIWGPAAPLRYATSKDLYHWEYKGKMMNTPGDRDPNVLLYDGTYYLVTCGLHCVNMATSKDLVNWTRHPPIITRDDAVDFESPYLVRYDSTFYLFACTWDNSKWDKKSVAGAYQHITYVYQSDDLFNFNATPITQIDAHASEIIRDEEGDWYLSSAEWPNRGISVAKLVWK